MIAVENPRIEEIFSNYEKDAPFYASLIRKVSEHPALTEWIKKRTGNDPRIINSISDDWKSILMNNPTFQDFVSDNIHYFKYESKTKKAICNYKIRDYSKIINILAIGTFKMSKENSDTNRPCMLKLVESVPVQLIGDIMSLHLKKSILHNPAFFFKGCKGLCLQCRNYRVPDDNLLCIQDAVVYRGDKLQYALREYCECLFDTPSKAIVHLEINGAYTFAENCKIAGNVKTVIFIDDIFKDSDGCIVGVLKKDMSEEILKREIEEKGGTVFPDKSLSTSERTTGLKRKNEEAEEIVRQKHITDSILSIPYKMNYVESPSRTFQVEDSVLSMPSASLSNVE